MALLLRQRYCDLSTSGWAPEALRLMKRKLGSNVDKGGWKSPAGAMSWMRSATSYGSNRREGCKRGFGSSYHMDACYYAYRSKLGGNALVVAGYGNNETFGVDIFNGTDSHSAEPTWRLREHWIAVSKVAVTKWNYHQTHKYYSMYYMYAAVKGLRSFVPEIKYLANFDDHNPAGQAVMCNAPGGGPNHDACDITTSGYNQNGAFNGGCGADADCKSGHVCRSGKCKVVLEKVSA